MPHPSIQCLTLAACVALAPSLVAQAPSRAIPAPPKEVLLKRVAQGSFDVTLAPLTEGARPGAWAPGRMSLDKKFHGDLEGTSQGEMMTAMSEVKGSGGYTAFEKVEGTLQGRRGTFVLLHHGLMTKGVPGEWAVVVVPDSGTGGLKGLEGRMTITITGKDHAYLLEYNLPGTD
jgi:Protein of unknown function (DUF3224)